MRKPIARLPILVLMLACCLPTMAGDISPKPIRQSELVALVAGAILPENVVREIQVRGLGFQPDASYRSQLKTAGANTTILAAIDSAKITPSGPLADKDLLDRLSNAGKFIRDKRFDEATAELNAAVTASFESIEPGFVMGELLREQERWAESVAVYTAVLSKNAEFPEAHTKLSFVLHRLGDQEGALMEAKAALERTPENAEAHKNAGLALGELRKFDAAAVEYRKALRLKPDYQPVHYDLGLMLFSKGDLEGALAEYKKASALDPNDWAVHHNMAVTLDKKGDLVLAAREYREAKRLNPKDIETRESLASTLMSLHLDGDAANELRELQAIVPDSEFCHRCLGDALMGIDNFETSEKEYRKAIEINPLDEDSHLSLGALLETQHQYDAALEEYRRAIPLDEDDFAGHFQAGRAMLGKKDYAAAQVELKLATNLKPSDATAHFLYAWALNGSGQTDDAIREYQESLSLDPKQPNVRLDLASALEKRGDWAMALDQYRRAAVADLRKETQAQYAAAQQRLKEHISSLKSAGKPSEATQLEAKIHAMTVAPDVSDRLDLALRAGAEASMENHPEKATIAYKEAVTLAERLQPHDDRLVVALVGFAETLTGRPDATEAQIPLERALKVTEEIYGPQSSKLIWSLDHLGENAMMHHDFTASEKFYSRSLDLELKNFGELSASYAAGLRALARMYDTEKAYDRSVSYLLSGLKIDEALYGTDTFETLNELYPLCGVYDRWGKSDKALLYARRALPILEKSFGMNSPNLIEALDIEAKALRQLGRADEAAPIEKRAESIRSVQASSN
jgi:tetratricopeptide (TPR) repeat protein